MKAPFRGFAAFHVVGCLLALLVSTITTTTLAFSPAHSLARSASMHSTQNAPNELVVTFKEVSPSLRRRRVVSYMADSTSATGEDSLEMSETSPKKGLLKRLSSVVPPAGELQKLVPLGLMFFCILFNYTILRDTKDVLMVRDAVGPQSSGCLSPGETFALTSSILAFSFDFATKQQVTAPKSGAEVIPFIKTYVNLPVAIVSRRSCS